MLLQSKLLVRVNVPPIVALLVTDKPVSLLLLQVNVPPIVASLVTDKPVPTLLQINVSAKVPLEKQSILSVTSSVPLVMLTPLLNSQTLSGSLYNILPPYSTSIPAPFEDAALFEFAANLIVRSLISTVVEFIVVVVPSTCKFPFTMTKPVSSPTTDGSM